MLQKPQIFYGSFFFANDNFIFIDGFNGKR